MEVTGHNTLSTDEISVTSNPHLRDIEVWNERDLPHYKKKVADRMFSGYISIFLGALISYALYLVFFATVASMFPGLYSMVSSSFTAQWVCLFLFYAIVFVAVFFYGKKSMVKFVASCHGEVAHDGNPFMKKLKLHIVISAVLCIAVSVVCILLFDEKVSSQMGLAVLESYMYVPAIISPLAYFIGSLSARNSMIKCPVCGRFDTVYRVKSSEDFGERQDGSHKEYDYKTERVGTKTTTTYYTDGSRTTRSEGIYGSVRYTQEYDDYSSLSRFTYLCRECSYVEETLEEKTWKTKRDEYRG